ncbi:MAG: hypothetical protein H0T51_16915 [Pirellulales bacterium]|nr:hypothetical protein [Pirellulales bacterium]
MNLSKAAKMTRVSAAVAAGITDVNSTAVDMKGFGSVQFIVSMGAITAAAVTSAKLQGSSDNSSFSDLEGTAVTIADDDDDQVFGLDLSHPRHRYVRCVLDRGTQNAVLDGIIAVQYLADREPVTQPATTTVEVNLNPAAGTA